MHMQTKRFHVLIAQIVFLFFAMNLYAAEWTFMVYLDADNNLEGAGIEDFLEMSSVGSDANVNIVVLFDRTQGYMTSYGNWTGTRRGLVQSGDVPDLSWGQDMGELNMGDPQTLTNFVSWGMQNYPANQYAVVLWNHGGGWRTEEEMLSKRPYKAVCWDDDNGGDSLEMREVRTALENAEAITGNPTLIGFDACVMAMVEVAYEVRNHSEVMVASAANEPGDGWPYELICADLTANPTMDAQTLGTMIVNNYYLSYGNDETQAAFDLTLMNDLALWLNNLAVTLSNDYTANPPACAAAAQDMISALDDTIIHAQLGPSWQNGHGMSIYFPSSYIDPDYNGSIIQLPNDTGWDEFLYDYTANMGHSWVSQARNATESYDTSYLDIYNFCEKLISLIPDALTVSPNENIIIEGESGGPFEPECTPYQLTNTGSETLSWQVTGTVNWLDILPATGTLSAGESAMVNICVNADANTLPDGVYTDTLEFVNLTSTVTVATHQVSLLIGTVDYFTENFENNDFDLSGTSITFTPDGNGGYTACIDTISAFNIDPRGGTRLALGEDSYVNVSLSNPVSLYDTTYNNFYVGSNGYITFTAGDQTYQISEINHFNLPRISPLYCDLSPQLGGAVSYKEFSNGVAVTYERILEYNTSNSNNFQVEMLTNGTIIISWLGIDTSNALVGLSSGVQPDVFFESDLSSYEPCSGQEPIEVLVFVGFTSGPYDTEVRHTLRALSEQLTDDYNVTNLRNPIPATLAAALTNKDVLLIPEQENATTVQMQRLGTSWAAVLNDFVSNGGIVVMTDYCASSNDSANAFINSAGLCQIGASSILSSIDNEQDVQVVLGSDPLVAGVNSLFTAKARAKYYASVTGGNIVVADTSDNPVVISCDSIGTGKTILMGFDFYTYNDDMAKILANAVRLGQD